MLYNTAKRLCALCAPLLAIMLPWYIGTMRQNERLAIERVQTGVCMERQALRSARFRGKVRFQLGQFATRQGTEKALWSRLGFQLKPLPPLSP